MTVGKMQLQFDASPSPRFVRIACDGKDPLKLSLAAPAFRFKEGTLGGANVWPSEVRVVPTAHGKTFRLIYPAQLFQQVPVRIEADWALTEAGAMVRKTARIFAARVLAAPATLESVLLLDEPVPDAVVYEGGGWQSLPLFTRFHFFGVEFPVATARAVKGRIELLHQPGKTLDLSRPFTSRTALIGWVPSGKVSEAFLRYVEKLRPQSRWNFNYNSWWTTSVPFTEAQVENLIETFGAHKLRFDTFTLDLGWSAREAIWEIDQKTFPNGFAPIRERLAREKSRLGLWWSPSNFYSPFSFDNEWAQAAGYETTALPRPGDAPLRLMCLVRGGRYQKAALPAMVKLARENHLGQMKFDGYLSECNATDHGHLPGALSREVIAEGMIEIFQALRKAQPDLWMEATCFPFPASPWWLQYTDSVLGSHGDDAPFGIVPALSYRESYTTSRDFFNFKAFEKPVPIVAQEVLGIIHQTPDPLYNDAVITALRGHQFISFYLNPKFLEDKDYGFLTDLMTWCRDHTELLSHTRMYLPGAWKKAAKSAGHGVADVPRQSYGYVHWNEREGLLVLRNPWIKMENVELTLDRELLGNAKPFRDFSAQQLFPTQAALQSKVSSGDTLKITMAPYETKVIHLSRAPREYSRGETFVPTVTVESHQSSLANVHYDGPAAPILDANAVTLPAENTSEWSTSVSGVSSQAGTEWILLIESQKPFNVQEAFRVNGRQVSGRTISSESGWAAAQPTLKQSYWKWCLVSLPAGAWNAQAETKISGGPVTVSSWTMSRAPLAVAAPRGEKPVKAFPIYPGYQPSYSRQITPPTPVVAAKLKTENRPARVQKIAGVYLDMLSPTRAVQGWGELQKNRSVTETPLIIADRPFVRGLGTHAESSLVYLLPDGKYRALHGFAGVTHPNAGSVEFSIWLNGCEVWKSGLMRAGQEPVKFDVPLPQAGRLELRVSDGGDGIDGDHAAWGEVWLETW